MLDEIPSWDIVYREYLKTNNRFIPKKKEIIRRTSLELDNRQERIVNKLFDDFLNKQNKLNSSSENPEDKSEKLVVNEDPMKQYEAKKINKEELRELNKFLQQYRTAESERQNLKRTNLTRYEMLLTSHLKNSIFYNELIAIGDKNKNETACLTLLSRCNDEEITTLLNALKEAKLLQAEIIRKREEIFRLENEECDIFRNKITELMEKEIETILINEQLENLLIKNEYDVPLWKLENCLHQDLIENLKTKFKNTDIYQDLLLYRRNIKAHCDRLLLENLILLIQIENNLRNMFINKRIDIMDIYGYDWDVVEKIQNSDWFKYLGATSNLKNMYRLKKNVNDLIEESLQKLFN